MFVCFSYLSIPLCVLVDVCQSEVCGQVHYLLARRKRRDDFLRRAVRQTAKHRVDAIPSNVAHFLERQVHDLVQRGGGGGRGLEEALSEVGEDLLEGLAGAPLARNGTDGYAWVQREKSRDLGTGVSASAKHRNLQQRKQQ